MCGDIYGIYMCGGESERGPPLRLCGVYVAMWDCMCLTRQQQLKRENWWNQTDQDTPHLRQRSASAAEDKVEFNWGYESPERKRSYIELDTRWDQIDVRMHFFHKHIKDQQWQAAANGMWFIEDYAKFMLMLQELRIDADTDETSEACTLNSTKLLPGATEDTKIPRPLAVHDPERPKKVKTINRATCMPFVGTENTRSEPCARTPARELPEGEPASTDSVCRIVLV